MVQPDPTTRSGRTSKVAKRFMTKNGGESPPTSWCQATRGFSAYLRKSRNAKRIS